MYDLKIDPGRPYHYFISVGIKSMKSDNPGEIYLKHGPLKYTNDDVERCQSASMMSKDKLFPTTNKEAIEMFDVSEVVHSVWSMCIAAAANDCTVHHFSSDFPLPDDFWEGFVKRANNNEDEREKLFNARIKNGGFI